MAEKGMLNSKRKPASTTLTDADFADQVLTDADFADKPLTDADFMDTSPEPMSVGQALRTRAEEGLLFGARPLVAGLGGAIGEAVARTKYDPKERGLIERAQYIAEGLPEGFAESRKVAQEEQKQANRRLGTAGLLVDVGTGILTAPLTPVRTIGQAAKVGAGMGAARALGEAESAGEAARMVGTGAALGGTVGAIGKGIASAASQLPSALSGIPKKAVQTFRQRPERVQKLIEESAGDIPTAADTLRTSWAQSIAQKRQGLGQQIGQALDAASPEKSIAVEPYVQSIDDAIAKLNPKLNPNEIEELSSLATQIRSLGAESDGLISARELHQVKEFLQDVAKPSYQKGGQIFARGDQAARAAKTAAAKINEDIRKKFPAIKSANQQLQKLHELEDVANKNLIKPGASENSVISAGLEDNRNAKNLKELGKIVGRDFLSEAEDLAAAKMFADPDILPVDITGKAAARQNLGTAIGTLAGAGVGSLLGGPLGAVGGTGAGIAIGQAISSPKGIKTFLKAINVTEDAARKVVGSKQFDRLMTNKAGRAFLVQQLSNAGAGLAGD